MIDEGKRSVLGVLVDVIDYEAATAKVVSAAVDGRPLAVTALAVHGVMTGVQRRVHGARLNGFDVVTPDGQPVRWALNLLHDARLDDRVYGPALTRRVLAACAAKGLPVFFYGSTVDVLDPLVARLRDRHPDLRIAGTEPSRFRLADAAEADRIADQIRASGARLVVVGLGCPRQEVFTWAMRHRLDLPVMAVGAAFDYEAGRLRPAPAWLQRHGLEWLWRLAHEPRRLWRRYLLLNPAYLTRLAAQHLTLWRPEPPAPARHAPRHPPI